MKFCRLFAVASVLLLTISGGIGQAGVVLFDNTSEGFGVSNAVASNGPLPDSFSTGDSSVVLTSLQLSLSLSGTTVDKGGFTIQLLSDSSSTPGSSLETLVTAPDSDFTPGADPVLRSFTFTSITTLSAYTRYWIAIYADPIHSTGIQWSIANTSNGTGVTAEYNAFSFAQPFDVVSANSDSSPFILQVNADVVSTPPPPVAVPEPASVVLAAFGVVVATLVGRRRLS